MKNLRERCQECGGIAFERSHIDSAEHLFWRCTGCNTEFFESYADMDDDSWEWVRREYRGENEKEAGADNSYHDVTGLHGEPKVIIRLGRKALRTIILHVFSGPHGGRLGEYELVEELKRIYDEVFGRVVWNGGIIVGGDNK